MDRGLEKRRRDQVPAEKYLLLPSEEGPEGRRYKGCRTRKRVITDNSRKIWDVV